MRTHILQQRRDVARVRAVGLVVVELNQEDDCQPGTVDGALPMTVGATRPFLPVAQGFADVLGALRDLGMVRRPGLRQDRQSDEGLRSYPIVLPGRRQKLRSLSAAAMTSGLFRVSASRSRK